MRDRNWFHVTILLDKSAMTDIYEITAKFFVEESKRDSRFDAQTITFSNKDERTYTLALEGAQRRSRST